VLRARAESNETRRQPLQKGKPLQEANEKRKRFAAFRFTTGYNIAVNETLHRLNQTRRPLSAPLHRFEIG
jgi:hypothetical protein